MEQKLNSVYDAGALNAYGLDVGYFITPSLQASVGYYYQHRDQEEVIDVPQWLSSDLSRLCHAVQQPRPLRAESSPTTMRLILAFLQVPHLSF